MSSSTFKHRSSQINNLQFLQQNDQEYVYKYINEHNFSVWGKLKYVRRVFQSLAQWRYSTMHGVMKDFPWAYSIRVYSSQCLLLHYSLHVSRKLQKADMPIIHCNLCLGNCKTFFLLPWKMLLSNCLQAFDCVCGFFVPLPCSPQEWTSINKSGSFHSVLKGKS